MSRILEQIKAIVPALEVQGPRIAIVGGCKEYTGAPFYASTSALRTGASSSHIFCTEEAVVPIQTYSPEPVVHPLKLTIPTKKEDRKAIVSWLKNMDALVIGPGLGRDPDVWRAVEVLFKKVRKIGIPLIVDGDGLRMVVQNAALVQDNRYAILTPNVVEFEALSEKFCGTKKAAVGDLARKLGNVTIVQKGQEDVVGNGLTEEYKCSEKGSPRRCGGQGDLLAGSLAVFASWGFAQMKSGAVGDNWAMLAGFAACSLVRHSSTVAYAVSHRATTTPDMIAKIGDSFEQLFG